MKHQHINIMGVPFTSLQESQVLALVLEKLVSNEKHFFIATPNPEMLLEARKNHTFKKLLNETDLNIPDGFGIVLASYLTGKPLGGRITGTDLMQSICRFAPEKTKIFLLGASPGIAEKTARELERQYPYLTVTGSYGGSPAPEEEEHIRSLINKSEAQVLFVAYGASETGSVDRQKPQASASRQNRHGCGRSLRFHFRKCQKSAGVDAKGRPRMAFQADQTAQSHQKDL